MQCRESKRILGAYVDNEIDLMQSLAFEDHLEGCGDCRQELQSQIALKGLIRNAGLSVVAPAELRREVKKRLGLNARSDKGSLWASLKVPAWSWIGMPLTALILLSVSIWFLGNHREANFTEVVVDNHIRSLLVNHLADVNSSDQHTVKPWFNGKLTFAPRVVDLSDKGFPLLGGRLDYMDKQRVAALVYGRRQHVINVFVYPSPANINSTVHQERGYSVINWACDGEERWAVSDLNLAELQEFVTLLRS